MAKQKYDAGELKAVCILLVVVIVGILWGWHNSESARLKILDELEEANSTIEEMRIEMNSMEKEISELCEIIGVDGI